eukprot:9547928-Karenia_brevis.AAC.1
MSMTVVAAIRTMMTIVRMTKMCCPHGGYLVVVFHNWRIQATIPHATDLTATWKQRGSNAEATKKQFGSDAEATRKQRGRNAEATRKYPEATRKQRGSNEEMPGSNMMMMMMM